MLGSAACATWRRNIIAARPRSAGRPRRITSAPTAFARRHATRARRSGASDSGSTRSPYAATQKPTRERGGLGEAVGVPQSKSRAARREPAPTRSRGRTPLALLGDVGDVGTRGRDARGGEPGQHAPNQEPDDVRRERHDDVVEAEPDVRQQDDRTAAKAVGERAEHGRRHELHGREQRERQPVELGRPRGVAADERHDERREHGHDETEGKHIEQHGDEDEDQRGPPSVPCHRDPPAASRRRNSSPEVETRSSSSAGWRADTNVAEPYSASTTGPKRARNRASWNMSTGFGAESG